MLRKLLFSLSIAGLLAAPALAQDGAEGIAFAQAPEAGLGICLGQDAAETQGCAQQICMDQSGLSAAECAVNLWCYPHGWAADLFIQHVEGIHFHDFLCGEFTQEKLEEVIAVTCDVEFYAECSAVQIWDPDGNMQMEVSE